MAKRLTKLQQAFVDAYCGEARGNGTRAAQIAGYAGDEHMLSVAAARALGSVRVLEAIKERLKPEDEAAIASIVEVQSFLTSMMRNAGLKPEARLKAADQLAKMQGAYIKKVEHSGSVGSSVTFYLPDNGRRRCDDDGD